MSLVAVLLLGCNLMIVPTKLRYLADQGFPVVSPAAMDCKYNYEEYPHSSWRPSWLPESKCHAASTSVCERLAAARTRVHLWKHQGESEKAMSETGNLLFEPQLLPTEQLSTASFIESVNSSTKAGVFLGADLRLFATK